MMRELLHQTNKKGISEMVSYVLLIVIAVGLSILVFAYIMVFVKPSAVPECKIDVNLVLQSYTCNNGQLVLTLVNKGLFNIDAAYVRLGAPDRNILPQINSPNDYSASGINFRFAQKQKLAPGEGYTNDGLPDTTNPAWTNGPPYTPAIIATPGQYKLEIEPAVFNEKGELALCKDAVITELIDCTVSS